MVPFMALKGPLLQNRRPRRRQVIQLGRGRVLLKDPTRLGISHDEASDAPRHDVYESPSAAFPGRLFPFATWEPVMIPGLYLLVCLPLLVVWWFRFGYLHCSVYSRGFWRWCWTCCRTHDILGDATWRESLIWMLLLALRNSAFSFAMIIIYTCAYHTAFSQPLDDHTPYSCMHISAYWTSGNRTAMSPDCVIYLTQGRDGYCNYLQDELAKGAKGIRALTSGKDLRLIAPIRTLPYCHAPGEIQNFGRLEKGDFDRQHGITCKTEAPRTKLAQPMATRNHQPHGKGSTRTTMQSKKNQQH